MIIIGHMIGGVVINRSHDWGCGHKQITYDGSGVINRSHDGGVVINRSHDCVTKSDEV